MAITACMNEWLSLMGNQDRTLYHVWWPPVYVLALHLSGCLRQLPLQRLSRCFQICQTVCRRRNGRNISRCCFWRHGFAASASRWGSPRASSFWPKACRVFWQLLQSWTLQAHACKEMTLTPAHTGNPKMGAGILHKTRLPQAGP